MTADLVVGDLAFAVRRSERRRTLGLTVERDGSLVLVAPRDCGREQMESFARRKAEWVYRKLAEKEMLPVAPPPKQFVSGEGFPYLGRSYRLLLVTDLDVPVKLEHGRFKMRRSDARDGREVMVRWYSEHALPWLRSRVDQFAGRLGVRAADVTVRDLGNRWGSCGKRGRLYFHWKSILLPARLVEYVVVHEVVHLLEPRHSSGFWRVLEKVLRDVSSRRSALLCAGKALTLEAPR